MSIHAMSWAIKVKGLPIATKAVLMMLADCHNGETGQCNPSMRHLMEVTGLKERALQIHLKTLEQGGFLVRDYVFHGRGKGCSVEQYNLKIGIIGAVKKPTMEAQDNAPAKQCARKIRSMGPQNIAPPYKEEPEENRNIPGKAEEVLSEIWKAWSPEGRKRSKAKGKLVDQLKAISKRHDLEVVKAAALAFARDGKPEFHPALDRWLKDGRFENWAPAPPESPSDLSIDEWKRAMRHWVETGEWLAADICPPPNDPDCKAPEAMIRHALKLRPETKAA